MPLPALLVIFALVQILSAVLLWRAWSTLQPAETQLRNLRAALAEIACYAEARQRLQERQQKFEQVVDSTADSVESIHRALANFSFDLWGRDAEQTRAAHDQRVEQVYGSVRGINRVIGKWAGNLLTGGSDSDRKD